MSEIEGIVKGGVIIPLKPLRELEGRKINIKIISVEDIEAERLYREGEDAEELLEIINKEISLS